MIEAHTNTTLNSSKKIDKETEKLWGLEQNQKAPNLWHEDERLWVSVYKVAKVQEVKKVNGNTKCFVLCEREMKVLKQLTQENKKSLGVFGECFQTTIFSF